MNYEDALDRGATDRRRFLGLSLLGGAFAGLGAPAGARSLPIGGGDLDDLALESLLTEARSEIHRWAELDPELRAEREERLLASLSAHLTRLDPDSPALELASPEAGDYQMRLLFYHPPLRAYLIAMGPGARFDLHDHRDTAGLIMPLSGRVECRHFEFVDPDRVPEPGATDEDAPAEFELVRSSTLVLEPGRVATLGRRRENVHEVVAGPDGALLIDLFCWPGAVTGSREIDLVGDATTEVAPGTIVRGRWRA